MSNGDEDTKCMICLANVSPEDRGTLGCNHLFCFECILTWSKNENSCPLCKHRFEFIRRDKVSRTGKRYARNVAVKKRIQRAPDHGFGDVEEDEGTACEACGGGDEEHLLLLCDSCSLGFHTFCLSPPLSRVPRGEWLCPFCEPSPPDAADDDEDIAAEERDALERALAASLAEHYIAQPPSLTRSGSSSSSKSTPSAFGSSSPTTKRTRRGAPSAFGGDSHRNSSRVPSASASSSNSSSALSNGTRGTSSALLSRQSTRSSQLPRGSTSAASSRTTSVPGAGLTASSRATSVPGTGFATSVPGTGGLTDEEVLARARVASLMRQRSNPPTSSSSSSRSSSSSSKKKCVPSVFDTPLPSRPVASARSPSVDSRPFPRSSCDVCAHATEDAEETDSDEWSLDGGSGDSSGESEYEDDSDNASDKASGNDDIKVKDEPKERDERSPVKEECDVSEQKSAFERGPVKVEPREPSDAERKVAAAPQSSLSGAAAHEPSAFSNGASSSNSSSAIGDLLRATADRRKRRRLNPESDEDGDGTAADTKSRHEDMPSRESDAEEDAESDSSEEGDMPLASIASAARKRRREVKEAERKETAKRRRLTRLNQPDASTSKSASQSKLPNALKAFNAARQKVRTESSRKPKRKKRRKRRRKRRTSKKGGTKRKTKRRKTTRKKKKPAAKNAPCTCNCMALARERAAEVMRRSRANAQLGTVKRSTELEDDLDRLMGLTTPSSSKKQPNPTSTSSSTSTLQDAQRFVARYRNALAQRDTQRRRAQAERQREERYDKLRSSKSDRRSPFGARSTSSHTSSSATAVSTTRSRPNLGKDAPVLMSSTGASSRRAPVASSSSSRVRSPSPSAPPPRLHPRTAGSTGSFKTPVARSTLKHRASHDSSRGKPASSNLSPQGYHSASSNSNRVRPPSPSTRPRDIGAKPGIRPTFAQSSSSSSRSLPSSPSKTRVSGRHIAASSNGLPQRHARGSSSERHSNSNGVRPSSARARTQYDENPGSAVRTAPSRPRGSAPPTSRKSKPLSLQNGVPATPQNGTLSNSRGTVPVKSNASSRPPILRAESLPKIVAFSELEVPEEPAPPTHDDASASSPRRKSHREDSVSYGGSSGKHNGHGRSESASHRDRGDPLSHGRSSGKHSGHDSSESASHRDRASSGKYSRRDSGESASRHDSVRRLQSEGKSAILKLVKRSLYELDKDRARNSDRSPANTGDSWKRGASLTREQFKALCKLHVDKAYREWSAPSKSNASKHVDVNAYLTSERKRAIRDAIKVSFRETVSRHS